jgi:glucokinase
MPDFSIGVDLGGTNLRIAAVTRDGQLLEKITLGTKVIIGRDQVIAEMCDAIQRLSAQYKSTGKLIGAGIGVPGIIDMATGTMRKSANLPGWENYPVRDEIERRLGARVVLDNDANVAALGEQWLGAARGIPNVGVVTLGTGIGGGIVLNGKIWHGMNGMSGEFGHVTVEPEGEPCACGNRGCAEKYASATAILRMAREAIATGDAQLLAAAASSDAEFGAKSIYNLALQGDEHARRIFHTFGRYLGILLADLINVLNLEMFVIGGGVSSAWDAFAPTMFEELRGRSLVYAATAPDDPPQSAQQNELEGHPAAPQATRGQQPQSAPQPMWGRTPSSVQAEQTSATVPQTSVSTEKKTIITRALLGSDAGLYGAAHAAELAG